MGYFEPSYLGNKKLQTPNIDKMARNGKFVGIPLNSNKHWDKKLVASYKLSGYPRYVLIDADGIVLEGWCERPSDPALSDRNMEYL